MVGFKKMLNTKLLFYFLSISFVICNDEIIRRKMLPTPNFRKQVEEISEETSTEDSNERIVDETGLNLVSLMVKNIKELFPQSEAPTLIVEAENENEDDFVTIKTVINPDVTENTKESTEYFASSIELYNDVNVTVLENTEKPSTCTFFEKTTESSEIVSSNDLLYKLENRKEESNAIIMKLSDPSDKNVFSSVNELITTKRSCISCDNILLDDCNDPKNKLIPSKLCKKDDDLCYSRHTPFGLVERGCFNINRNQTIYVCSCNLCNYVSMVDMPYIFSTKQEWIKNVIELSRTKRFRKTIFKEMSCLMCEVNVTSNAIDVTYNANCLQGNIGVLPTQECAENEICGIKVIKSKGYVWRGCLSVPLYNHWWTLCDSDLCNYDSIISMLD